MGLGDRRLGPGNRRLGPGNRRLGIGDRSLGLTDRRLGLGDRGRRHRLDDGNGLPQPVRADADNRRTPHTVHLLDVLLGADRRNRTSRSDDDVRQTPLDPQPPVGVEVTDVTGAVPTTGARSLAHRTPVRQPEPVVRLLEVRGRDHDLAEDAWSLGRDAGGTTLGIQCADQHAIRLDRCTDADAAVRGIRRITDTRERHVRDEQTLGHAVRRVRLGVRHEPCRSCEQRLAHRGPRRKERAHSREREAITGGKCVSCRDHVQDRRRREEDHPGIRCPHRRRNGLCREGARRRDVHVGGGRACPERRAEQRERGEAGDEPRVSRNVEVRGQNIAHGRELAMRVDDALGGPGRTGGEEDRGVVAGLRLCRERGCRAVGGDRGEIVRDAERHRRYPRQPCNRNVDARPAQRASGGETRQLADHDVGPRAAHGTRESAHAQSRVGHNDDRPDAQTRVDHRGERRSRRHEHRHALPFAHADARETRSEAAYAIVELTPADAAFAAARGHVDHRDAVVVAARIERCPQRREFRRRRVSARFTCPERPLGGLRRGTPGQVTRHEPVTARFTCPERPLGGLRRGTSGQVTRHEPVTEPREHRIGVRPVLGDEVAGTLEAVHVGVRQPLDEIIEVAVAEDRIGRSPQQQRGHLQVSDAGRDALQFAKARVFGIRRNVRDERADAPPTLGSAIWRAVSILHDRIEGGMREAKRGLQERGGGGRGCREHPPCAGDPQRGGNRRAGRVMHRGVERDDSREKLRMIDRPAE